jgi:hypothetical protein
VGESEHREANMRAVFAIVLGLAVAVACESSDRFGRRRFRAFMDGPHETPVTASAGTGTATFVDNGGSMGFTVTAQGLSSNWTLAHIHLGDAGIPGGIIVDLATPDGGAVPPNATSGTITGTITGPKTAIRNPTAPLGDGGFMTFDDLLILMQNGNTYVNVHTTANQGGEIRGQISPE